MKIKVTNSILGLIFTVCFFTSFDSNCQVEHTMTEIVERGEYFLAEQNNELQIRQYLLALNSYKIEMLAHLAKSGLVDSSKTQLQIDEGINKYMTKNIVDYSLNPVATKLGIPNVIPNKGIADLRGFDGEFDKWKRKLYHHNEEGKMFSYEIKNAAQDKAKNYQSLSKLEQLMHKTMLQIIKKIK